MPLLSLADQQSVVEAQCRTIYPKGSTEDTCASRTSSPEHTHRDQQSAGRRSRVRPMSRPQNKNISRIRQLLNGPACEGVLFECCVGGQEDRFLEHRKQRPGERAEGNLK